MAATMVGCPGPAMPLALMAGRSSSAASARRSAAAFARADRAAFLAPQSSEATSSSASSGTGTPCPPSTSACSSAAGRAWASARMGAPGTTTGAAGPGDAITSASRDGTAGATAA
eukprot:329968-Pyramimonas_sp.AAC.1